jgi:hypothetical protein
MDIHTHEHAHSLVTQSNAPPPVRRIPENQQVIGKVMKAGGMSTKNIFAVLSSLLALSAN